MLRKVQFATLFIGICLLIAFNPFIASQAQSQSRSVILIVDQKFYEALEAEIQRWANDIQNDLGATVIIEMIDPTTTTPEDIRVTLQELYTQSGLQGSILVGDIPVVYLGDWLDIVPFATDAFYEDLDDSMWVDPDGNGVYNIATDEDEDGNYDWFYKVWIAEHNREVWSARLQPPASVDLEQRIALLRAYLDRNHVYRTGQFTYQHGMVYAESVAHNGDPNDGETDYTTVYSRAVTIMDESWLFDRPGGDPLNFVWSEDLTQHMNDWLMGVNGSYEYGFLNVHGSPDGQFFGGENALYPADYQNTPANTLLIDLASCSNADFTFADYLGGWILFGGEALAVTGNTTVTFYVGSPEPNPDHRLLSLGLTLGEVRLTDVLGNESYVLLGDPTLRLRQPTEGPEVTIDTNLVTLPAEPVPDVAGFMQSGRFTVTNNGNKPATIYYRIMSLTSLDGKRPWGDAFQTTFYVRNHFFAFPATLAAGESRSFDIDFIYDGSSGAGIYRAGFLIYTNSSSSPYFWIDVEKTLYHAIWMPVVLHHK